MNNNDIDTRGHSALYEWRNYGGMPLTYGGIGGSCIAKVIGINWSARTIHCIGAHQQLGAGPWQDVPIASTAISQMEGLHWIPDVAPDFNEIKDEGGLIGWIQETENNLKNNTNAILLFVGNNFNYPICIGFILDGPSEFSFDEPGTRIDRHTSNIYQRTTKEGTYEFSFPDGTYLKIAKDSENLELKDLTGSNVDSETKPWSIKTDEPRYVYLKHVSGTTISIDTQGNVLINSLASVNVEAETIAISGNSGNVTIGGISLTSHHHDYSDTGPGTHSTTQPIG